MKNIRTVLKDIPADQLGFTYNHEHLFAVPPPQQKDRDLELSDYDKSLEELMRFKKAGGNTLVEASTIDYGRNIEAMVKMSQASGVNVVATTGFNKHIYYPAWVAEKSMEEIAEVLIRDLTEGIDGTPYKAGFLKGGSFYNLIHPLEEKTTRAVALAHKKTGAPIWMHTEAGTMSWELLSILLEEGIDPTKVVMGHMDRNIDLNVHLKIVKTGASVQFDGPGKVKYAPDSQRIELLRQLVEAGHLERIFISGDMGRASYLHAYGGGPGFEFLICKFIPRLLEEGFTQQQIDTIFVKNPARWLAQF